MQSFTVSRFATSTFEINGKGYMVGGLLQFTSLNDCWEYSANTWTQKANFPGGVRGAMFSFATGGKGYCGIGGDAPNSMTYKTFYEFDPVANSWTQKSDFPGLTRYVLGAMVYNGKGYLSNGIDSTANIPMNEVYEYNPANDTWTAKTPLPSMARFTTYNFTIGPYGYACSGFTGSMQVQDLWEYDMVNDTWSQKANFPGIGRLAGCGFAIGNFGYYGLGIDVMGGPVMNDFYQYDQAGNSWSTAASLNDSFNVYRGSFMLNGKGYVVGGQKGSNQFLTDKTWEFTPPVVGYAETEDPISMHIYPNPFVETAAVIFPGHNQGSNTLRIYDLTGKLIKETAMNGSRAVITKESLSSGTYLVQIESSGKVIASSKLLVL